MRKTMLMNVILLFLATALIASPMIAQKADPAEVQLKAAIQKEVEDGDLRGVIGLYAKLAESPNRAVAAQALVRMGQCYDKLGDAEARKAYERVIREFGDQKATFDEARRCLARLGERTRPDGPATVSQERVWGNVASSQVFSLAPSPDGNSVIYAGSDGNLRYRDLASNSERAITADAQMVASASLAMAVSPRVSPDGRLIVYLWFRLSGPRGSLRIIGVDGSGMREINDRIGQPRAWSPDGQRIMVWRQVEGAISELALVSVADGTRSELATGTSIGATQNAFSRDGRFIVYQRREDPTKNANSIWIMNADGSAASSIVADPTGSWSAQDAMWTPDGRSIVFTSNRSGKHALWLLPMTDGRPKGSPELLAANCEGMSFWGVTQSGSLFYTIKVSNRDVYVADLDPATLKVTSTPRRLNQQYVGEIDGKNIDWGPDGRSLVYTRSPLGATGGFLVHSIDTHEEQLVKPVTAAAFPEQLRFSQDGRSVLSFDYYANQGAFLRRIDLQSGQATTVFHLPGPEPSVFWQPALSRDGQTLFYSASTGKNEDGAYQSRLVRRNLESGEETNLVELASSNRGQGGITVSPDGKQVAFVNSYLKDGPPWLMTVPSDGGPPRRLCQGAAVGLGTAWTKDGRHVLFLKPGTGGMQLFAIPAEGGVAQPISITMGGIAGFALNPDNSRIAFLGGQPQTDLWVFRNLFQGPMKQ